MKIFNILALMALATGVFAAPADVTKTKNVGASTTQSYDSPTTEAYEYESIEDYIKQFTASILPPPTVPTSRPNEPISINGKTWPKGKSIDNIIYKSNDYCIYKSNAKWAILQFKGDKLTNLQFSSLFKHQDLKYLLKCKHNEINVNNVNNINANKVEKKFKIDEAIQLMFNDSMNDIALNINENSVGYSTITQLQEGTFGRYNKIDHCLPNAKTFKKVNTIEDGSIVVQYGDKNFYAVNIDDNGNFDQYIALSVEETNAVQCIPLTNAITFVKNELKKLEVNGQDKLFIDLLQEIAK